MPQFNFFCSSEEAGEILKSILGQGGYNIAPNLNYLSPDLPLYSELSQSLTEAIKINPVVYIVSRFTKLPLEIGERKSGSADGTYYINLNYSINLWGFKYPQYLNVNKHIHIVPATFYMPRCYYDQNHNPVKVSNEVRLLYNSVLKLIKIHLRRVNIGGAVWAAPEALRLVQEGKALILCNGNWLDSTGKVICKNQ